jgi:anti-sigma factor RsiW
MDKHKLESQLIDYIDGKLNDTERKLIEQELMQNAEAFSLYEQLKEVMQLMSSSSSLEPSLKMRSSFNDLLQQEMKDVKKTKVVFFRPVFYKAAAAVALLIVGVSLGFWISKYERQQDEMEAIKKELKESKQVMMAMLENQQSASQRVLGATVAFKMENPDQEIMTALVTAMNQDPNTNVRLAALDALGKFRQEPLVRKALIESLSTQKDPVVQIALIRLLVEMKEKSTIGELQRITTDEKMIKEVKDEAHAGLLRLS